MVTNIHNNQAIYGSKVTYIGYSCNYIVTQLYRRIKIRIFLFFFRISLLGSLLEA